MTNPFAEIPMTALPGWRDYELKILAGELYEVWLHRDWEEPKPCVPVDRTFTMPGAPDWKALVAALEGAP